MKNLKKKYFVRNFVLTVLVLTFMVSEIMPVKGALISRDFNFNFIGNGYWDVTETVNKTTDTSIRMKCTYAEIEGSCYEAVVVSMPGAAQCCPKTYRYYEGTSWDMINYVNENGYEFTRIDAYCVDDVDGQGAEFAGWWYADLK